MEQFKLMENFTEKGKFSVNIFIIFIDKKTFFYLRVYHLKIDIRSFSEIFHKAMMMNIYKNK